MNDYRRKDFFIVKDKKNNKRFYIRVKNQIAEVPKEVYCVYYNSYCKQLL